VGHKLNGKRHKGKNMLELDCLNAKRPPKEKCSQELTICCLSTGVCIGEAQSMGGRGGGAGLGWAGPFP